MEEEDFDKLLNAFTLADFLLPILVCIFVWLFFVMDLSLDESTVSILASLDVAPNTAWKLMAWSTL